MTQEDRKLLLTDLCARSPYGVMCQFIWTYSDETIGGKSVTAKEDDNIKCIDIHTKEIQADYYGEWVDLEHCKPYLRPMSSMTEEEWTDYQKIRMIDWVNGDINGTFINAGLIVDWLNAHHFDYRGLIEKELAIAVTEENNPYEN